MNNGKKTKKLVTSAMLLAIATAIDVICECIPFLNLPFGGTISIAGALPVIIIGYFYGPSWGFGSAFVYSVLQIAIGCKTVAALFTPTDDSYMGITVAVCVIALDYVLAYTSLGLGSLFYKKYNSAKSLVAACIISLLASYIFHVVSGAIFYGAWAEWFFTDTVIADFAVSKTIMKTFSGSLLSLVYSIIYNGCYMIPEIIITAVVAVPVFKVNIGKLIK